MKFIASVPLWLGFLLSSTCIFGQMVEPNSFILVNPEKRDTSYVNTLITKAIANYYNNTDSVILYAQSAEQIAKEINFHKGRLKARYSLIKGYYYKGEVAVAHQKGLEALEWYPMGQYPSEIAYIKYNLAQVYWYTDNFKRSMEVIKQVMAYAEFVKDSVLISNCYHVMGLTHYANNEMKEAIPYFHNSIKFEASVQAYTNLADCYMKMGDFVNARKYITGHALRMLGANDARVVRIISMLGEIHLKQNNLDSAEFYVRKALSLREKFNFQIGGLSFLLAEISSKRGDFKTADKYFNKGYEEAKKESNILNQISASERLYKYYESRKDMKTAYRYLRELKPLYDSLTNVNRANFVKEMETNLQMEAEIQRVNYNREIEQLAAEKKLAITRIVRNILVVGIVIAFLLIGYIFNNYLKKQKINALLETKNTIISKQNVELQENIANLHKTQQQLIESEKMASLGLLAAGVAHEIRNPLNYISGAVTAMSGLRENFHSLVTLGDTKHERLLSDFDSIKELIQTGVKRSTKIVSSLNHFSAPQDSLIPHTTVDLEEVMEESLTLLNFRFKESAIIVERSFLKSGHISGNSSLLVQVCVNILNNAVDAVEPITGPRIIKVGIEPLPSNVRISICDNGTGVSEWVKEKIFTPFFTTKPQGKGTGLGLSIAFGIVKKHQGQISFNSTKNGTCFFVDLPVGLG